MYLAAIDRAFHPARERYWYDENLKGLWAQVDTRNDAPYFGVWLNPEALSIVTYCEGDETTVRCLTPEHFAAEVQRLADYYSTDGRFGIDPGWPGRPKTEQISTLIEAMGLGQFLH